MRHLIKSSSRFILAIIILLIIPTFIIRAETTKILQAYTTEQIITIFTSNAMDPSSLRCSASNQDLEIISTGALSGESVELRTTILVDSSASMPNAVRGTVTSALKNLIEGKSPNEKFRIATFAEELSVLQDFTADRYDLTTAVDKIAFDGKQSIIYDALYNTIPQLTLVDGKVTFYRTVIFTDGVDDTMSGVTKEELFLKLKNDHYPIDIVAVSRVAEGENKDLSAIMRMSSGRYYNLNPNTNISELMQALGLGDYFYIVANAPPSLLDGVVRQVDINNAGSVVASGDIKFLAFSVPEEPEIVVKDQPAPIEVAEPSWLDQNWMMVVIAVTVVLILLAAGGLVVFLLVRKTNESEFTAPVPATHNNSGVHNGYNDLTEFIGDPGYTDEQPFTVRLYNLNTPEKIMTHPIKNGLLIGRADHCAVRLHDRSVSREQCKLIPQDGGVAVVHISTSNATLLNGVSVKGISPIKAGDELKFGREALQIYDIQVGETQGNEPSDSSEVYTETVF